MLKYACNKKIYSNTIYFDFFLKKPSVLTGRDVERHSAADAR